MQFCSLQELHVDYVEQCGRYLCCDREEKVHMCPQGIQLSFGPGVLVFPLESGRFCFTSESLSL